MITNVVAAIHCLLLAVWDVSPGEEKPLYLQVTRAGTSFRQPAFIPA